MFRHDLMAMHHGSPEPIAVAILAKSPPGAGTLPARSIEFAVNTAKTAAIGPVTLWVARDPRQSAFQTLSALFGIAWAEQPHGDLGACMLAAIEAARGPAIVIGTDCAALTPAHLRTAAQALAEGVDVVIAPVEDGGYGLIGMQRPQPALFADMTWTAPSVMAETRRRLTRLGLSWREPARLPDHDAPADLARLHREGLASLMR